MEAEYITTLEATKEDVWLKNFLMNLEVVRSAQSTITLFYDNSRAVANSNDPMSHKRGKHIERKYYLILEINMSSNRSNCIKLKTKYMLENTI